MIFPYFIHLAFFVGFCPNGLEQAGAINPLPPKAKVYAPVKRCLLNEGQKPWEARWLVEKSREKGRDRAGNFCFALITGTLKLSLD